MDAKSSNFVVVKLVRFLNSVGVDRSVASTFQTPLVWSTKCHNKSPEVQAINPT